MLNKTFLMNTKSKLVGFSVALIVTLVCSLNVYAHTGEHVVILWDVTGSLLPVKKSKDLNGQPLMPYKDGNGLWVDLKKAVIDCIQYTESDPGSKITVVTFHDVIRDVYTKTATEEGKIELVQLVEDYKYQVHSYTNIVDPINMFYGLLDRQMINYMFLFTDGDHSHPQTQHNFIPTLDSWTCKTSGYDAYGFYVLVHPDADKDNIRRSVESQNNFWVVSDSKNRIKICTLPSSIKYNIRDDKGPKTICMSGKFANAEGDVNFVANDPYYDVWCSCRDVKDGKFDMEIKPKAGVFPPSLHTILLSPTLTGANNYTFIGPNQVQVEVSNLPERSLNLKLESNKLGTASYYESFIWVPEKSTSVVSKVEVDFSEQALNEGSSAMMEVYFVDRKGGKKLTPSKLGLKLLINGREVDSIKLTPELSEVEIEVAGDGGTEDGMYYGRIRLIPSNLDNCSINNAEDIFKWKLEFDQNCNPLKLALIILLVLLASAFLLWMFVFRSVFYPKFGSVLKTFTMPGMAPLIVRFRGTRKVVVSAAPQKKQSAWNRFWTGKIVHLIHPAFETPMEFVPAKGKRILVKAQAGLYQIIPNPMPGIGAATITDIKRNLRINVN